MNDGADVHTGLRRQPLQFFRRSAVVGARDRPGESGAEVAAVAKASPTAVANAAKATGLASAVMPVRLTVSVPPSETFQRCDWPPQKVWVI